MNIARLGVVVDPTGAQQGARAVDAAIDRMSANMVAAVGRVEQAVNSMAANTVAGARRAGAETEALGRRSAANVQGQVDGMRNMVGVYQALARAAAAIAGSMALGGIIKEGVRFNMVMQDSVSSIAAVQRQFHPDQFQDMASAIKAAGDAVELLKQKAAVSPASFEQLVRGFQATAGAAARANLSMKQHVDLVVLLSQAFKALNIPQEQMVSEMRSLITGNINQDSDAAKMLNITREDIQRATAAGTLFDFLTGKMAAFAEAGESASKNLSTILSNTQDKLQQIFAEIAAPIFETLTRQATAFLATLNDGKMSDAFANIGTAIANLIAMIGEFTRIIVENIGVILSVAEAMVKYWAALKVVQFTSWIIGLRASTAAVNAETTALAANAAARARRQGIGLGVGMAATMALDGGAFSGLGAALGSMTPMPIIGALIGSGLGALVDKIRDSAKATASHYAAAAQSAKEVADQVERQVGLAVTENDRAQARAKLEAEIVALRRTQAELVAGDADNQKIADVSNALAALMTLKGSANPFGNISRDRQNAADVAAEAAKATAELRRQVDMAESVNQKQEARLALEVEIANVQKLAEQAQGKGDAQLSAIKDYLAILNDILATFEAMAGKRAIEKKEQQEANDLLMAAKREHGDILEMAKARLENDVLQVQKLEDKKRIEELLKALGTDIATAKKTQLDYVTGIVNQERQLKDIEAGRAMAELDRANRLRNIRNESGFAGENESSMDAQNRQIAESNRLLAEQRRQYAEVQQEQAALLRAQGVQNVPNNLTANSVLELNSAANGIKNNEQALTALGAAFQKLAAMEDGIVSTLRTVADSAKKISRSVPDDAMIMEDFRAKIDEMKKANMPPAEMAYRRNQLEENTVGQLAQPANYEADLSKWRVYQEEKVRAAKDAETKMQAGAMTTSEAFSNGAKKAADAWGNFDQQVSAAGEKMMNVLTDGLGTALTDIVTGTKTASEAFRDMAVAIIREIAGIIIKLLIQLAIQMAINAATGKATNYNFGAIMNSVTGLKFANGGAVGGGRGGIDDVPAWLTAGEYVLNRDAVRNIGTAELDRMNSNRYASGGMVGAPRGAARSGGNGGGNITANVSVTYNAGSGKDEKSSKEEASQTARNLEKVIIATLEKQKRQGGTFS